MLKKINTLLTIKQKITLIFLFFANFILLGLEFLSLASVPFVISYILSPESNSFNNIFLGEILKQIDIQNDTSKIIFIGLFFIFLLKNIFYGLVLYFEAKFSFNLRIYLTNKLFKKYLALPYVFHVNNNPGKLIRNMTHEVTTCCSVVDQLLIIFRNVFLLMVIVALLLVYDQKIIFPILLFLGLIVGLFLYKIKDIIKTKGKVTQNKRASINTKVHELINGIKEIKIMNLFKPTLKSFSHDFFIAEYNSFFIKVLNSFPKIILEMSGITLIVSLFLIYSFLSLDVNTLLPVLSLVAVSIIRAIPCINALIVHVQNIIFQRPSVSLIYNHLYTQKILQENDTKNKISFSHNVELKNISFSFSGRNKNIIKNISLNINQGKKIGIIGSSGSGKTTLLNLILGLIKPTKGKILIDKKNIEQINLQKFWQDKIGYISQNIFLIDDTIKNNIAIGESKVDKKKLAKVLKNSKLYNFVQSLPRKENTLIGNNGVKISGGQHQRIGIARALYRNPSFLVMDEATSALDFNTENEILMDLDLKNSNTTAIVVSHRPRSVQDCDIVYYLEQGRIKDFGKYEQLQKKHKELKFNSN